MNQTARQIRILDILHARRLCTVAELSEELSVSDETIRRDIRQLEEEGDAVKVHGGVRLPENVYETPFVSRMKEREDVKRGIAAQAAQLIPDGASLFIDSGTTSAWTAKALLGKRSLTVVTNALEVAKDLQGQSNTRIFLAGGEINADYSASFGLTAIDFVSEFSTDYAILSMGAINSRSGLMDFHLGEVEVKKAALERTNSAIVVADSMKFERNGLIKAADFDQIQTLVTDRAPPPDLKQKMPDVEVVLAAHAAQAAE